MFPEEFATFLVSNPRLRETFLALHADLLEPHWWQARQTSVASGHFEDVFPYSESLRFNTTPRRQTPHMTAPAHEVASAACG